MSLSPCLPEDRFGFYQVGNVKTYKKFDAINEHIRSGIHPQWVFNDNVFRQYNWTIEPKESLETLYRLRAQQLRDKYDYLVLFYSGGADSTNVLNTFIKNKIKLDEICTFFTFDGNKHQYAGNDSEVALVAKPYAEEVIKANPHIKLRLIDISTDVYNLCADHAQLETYIYGQSAILMPKCGVWQRITDVVPEYKAAINANKRIGFIWACDKPRVLHNGARYYVQFLDIIDNVVRPGTSEPVEFFYWTPDLPSIVIKQGHIIKRYLESAELTSMHITLDPTGLACKKTPAGTLWLTTHGVHSLIYPSWDINTFSVGKSASPIADFHTSPWFFKLDNDIALSNWKGIVSNFWKDLPSYWKNCDTNLFDGIKGMRSQEYFLN